ncbi:DUF501 domain-containing protein [Gleimia sp. 6138-11-ORH1]|uniref:DUF501 domain-containing protein n=1 Tax=Gleimia sp. 6138-11-ORH1 TaxID=2973937 RepID=UPI002168A5B7|nr:DUF501 domain-containing protein [Gleimia sp. 6138-11-ORH1]MCS4485214.1 DUF501 domain-containing protein [Gleimia sp. 6138-11-ORH1]
MTISEATAQDLKILELQLGRVPRGVMGIAYRCNCGAPAVVATKPRLEDGTPFPTMYYLTHPAAVKGCSVLEAGKWMEELNQLLAEDEALRTAYAQAHNHYISSRDAIEEVPEIKDFSAGGMPNRVKCLHAILGHTLAAGQGVNPIGDILVSRLEADGLWKPQECSCLPGQTPADLTA